MFLKDVARRVHFAAVKWFAFPKSEVSTAPVLAPHQHICLPFIRQTLMHEEITSVFLPGFQLATGKEGRFLYVFDRAGIQHAPSEGKYM